MKKLLSVIIVTYNSDSLIFDCLQSIIKHNDIGDGLEIIIVDNNSEAVDNLFTRIKSTFKFDFILLKNSGNNGYGDGNNLGVKHSSSNRFIVMNPDVRILRPIFAYLLFKLEQNPKIGLLGVTFSDKSCPLYFKPEYFNLFRMIFFKVYVRMLWFDMQRMYLSGSFLLFDKESFLEAGGFDPGFFLFYEEADISNRILNVGKQVVLAPEVEVFHLTHGRSFNQKLATFELDSLLYYVSKYGFDIQRILARYLSVYRTKVIIASIFNNVPKKALFQSWENLIIERRNGLPML